MVWTVVNSREPRELELLYRLSQTLGGSLELRDVTQPALSTLAEHLNLKHGTITLLNRKTGDIHIEVAHGLSGQQTSQVRYRLGEGVTGKVIETGEPQVIPKTSESETFLDRTRRGKSAEVLLPVRAHSHGQRDLRRAQRRSALRPEPRSERGRPRAPDRRRPDRPGGQAAPYCRGGEGAARGGERAPARPTPRPLPPRQHRRQLARDAGGIRPDRHRLKEATRAF